MRLYVLIDRVPELPYFVLALFYALSNPLEDSLHVFSVAFLYLSASLAVGLLLKAALKTKRPVDYACIPVAKYDVPSLHTMVSVGAVAFIYFVEPIYSLIMAPVGILYMYSRVKLCFHTKTAVYVGAAVGVAMGAAFGTLLSSVSLRGFEAIACALFFLVPVSATVFRLRYMRPPRLVE
jgi:membrane-associated phospholipid phosphatase